VDEICFPRVFVHYYWTFEQIKRSPVPDVKRNWRGAGINQVSVCHKSMIKRD